MISVKFQKLDGLVPFLMLGVLLTVSINLFFHFLPTIVLGLFIGLILYGLNALFEFCNIKKKSGPKIIDHE